MHAIGVDLGVTKLGADPLRRRNLERSLSAFRIFLQKTHILI